MSTNDTQPDYTLSRAHGTVMVFSWMVFASSGVLFARYGRSIRFNKMKQILGDDIWFQVHRLSLVIAVIGTLLGFFLILGQAGGQWVDLAVDGGRLFAHSILGGIIVCCALIQAWMALFRCHPDSPFRFIFNWVHRTTGALAFILSVPTIFLGVFILQKYHDGFVTIMSLWTAWIVIVFIIFEIVESRRRSMSSKIGLKNDKDGVKNELNDEHSPPISDTKHVQAPEDIYFNTFKLIIFLLNALVAISFVIVLVVLIWMQV